MLTLPLIALRNVVVMPGMMLHFDVNRKVSVVAVEKALRTGQPVFAVTQLDPAEEQPDIGQLYTHGTITTIKQLIRLPGDIIRVLAVGEQRAILQAMDYVSVEAEAEEQKYYFEGTVQVLEEKNPPEPGEAEAMLRCLRELLESYAKVQDKLNKETVANLLRLNDLEKFIEQFAVQIPLTVQEKEMILSAADVTAQFRAEAVILVNETNIVGIKRDIQEKVKRRVDKNQRDYMLREQLKVVQEELGEGAPASDAEKFAEQCEALHASEEIKEGIRQEIRRFRMMNGSPSEVAVSRGYIETLLALPWDKESKDRKDIRHAEKVLEEDHYGLKKVKERVLEFLAVREATSRSDSPIICLVGPPGTGKTSIARSIATALEKKYVRICLGGVRDEAEIRGHRRTYVGALPGRIIQGIKTAGVKNPLMLLDEIDKLGNDYKGDPASALLEVLDGEQNGKFVDHYVELPVDLSQVLFIATANTTQTIPAPLLDRMEVIEVNSYTANEKLQIAKRHLVKKQLKKNGLTKLNFSITDKALTKLIGSYTREAGVRSLERRIGECMRKAVLAMAKDTELTKVKVSDKKLVEYLGKPKYEPEKKNEKDEVGIVRGLAVTGAGGDTLSIEINTMLGKGNIELTGQLGDVMKESARTALSYVRSQSERYQIPADYFEKHDLHLHIPEGAVPKDGPSAGCALATAILSVVTGKKIRANLAMTGEVTLRGRVLPIGGVKEKVLAAKLAGITLVLVPKKNEPDVQELESEITEGLRIVAVEHMDEVIREALVEE